MVKEQSKTMFYGANPQTFQKAMTETEKKLWSRIKNNQLNARFKRQHPIGFFIADFYCHEHKLVIEIDGGYHTEKEQMEYDKAREEIIKQYGIRVLRFSNESIDCELENVI